MELNIKNIPKSLREEAAWCCWKFEERDGRKTKVPYNPKTGGKAQSDNIDTFGSFEQACFAKDMNGFDGIGIGIFNGFCAIDIDHCIDDGVLSDVASDILDVMHSYTEYSPSGTGLHIIFKAPGYEYDKGKYYIKNPNNGVEAYCCGATARFMTVTGNTIYQTGVNDRSEELDNVLGRFMCRKVPQKQTSGTVPPAPSMELGDEEIISIASRAKNGDLFQRLYKGDTTGYDASGGQNGADIALCNILAFYTKDPERIDRIFRSSGLMREKWDRKTGATTYGAMTIEKAIDSVPESYMARIPREETKDIVPRSSEESELVVAPSETDIGDPFGEENVMLLLNKSGNPEKSARNVMRILQQDPNLDGHIYYDKFRHTIRVQGSLPWPSDEGPRDWDNADDSMLNNYVEHYIVGVPDKQVTNALTEVSRENAVDPLQQFLLSLKWDGKPRIATALHEYLGAEQNEWSDRAFRHWLVGAVARGLEPGCKMDEMLVLFGSQGAGKSTFLSRFSPDEEWVHENLTRIDDKDALQVLKGKWIVLFDELLAQKRNDMRELCKSFLVGRMDTFRPSYGRRFENHKRRCVFAGSTNERYFLTDPTGNRRYLPVACNKENATKNELIFDRSPEVTNEFIQMVAEAVDNYKHGYVLAVLGDFSEMQKNELDKYMEEDSRTGLVSEFLANTSADRVCVPMLSYEALGGSKTPSKREVNELHNIMQSMKGWALYDGNGGRARCGQYGVQRCYVRCGYVDERKLKKGELI